MKCVSAVACLVLGRAGRCQGRLAVDVVGEPGFIVYFAGAAAARTACAAAASQAPAAGLSSQAAAAAAAT